MKKRMRGGDRGGVGGREEGGRGGGGGGRDAIHPDKRFSTGETLSLDFKFQLKSYFQAAVCSQSYIYLASSL